MWQRSSKVIGLACLFDRLRVPVASDKVEGPSTCLKFLGIQIDTQWRCLRLPQDKLADLKQLVSNWIEKKSCSLADLQSLVGKLQHACKVVRPGRTFLRRMFELLKGRPRRQHTVHLNKMFQSDVVAHVFGGLEWHQDSPASGGRPH